MALKFLLLICLISGAFGACPENCQCLDTHLGIIVHCSPTSVEQLQIQIGGLAKDVVELHIGDYGNIQCNLGQQLSDNTFAKLPQSVVNLYIEKCKIKILGAKAFSGMKFVEVLYIISNPIEALPQNVISDAVKLSGFIVRDCPLKLVKANVFNTSPCFQRLEISGSLINDINTAFTGLQNCVMNLNVSHNDIKFIKKSAFYGLQNLAYLDISNNLGLQFDDLVFNDLVQLRYLSMAGIASNGNNLPETLLSGLSHLIFIDIANNGFTGMPKAVMFLKDVLNLQYLDVSNNVIVALNNEDFKFLPQLHTLQASHSNISSLEPDSLRGLAKLTKLNLIGNQIQSLPDDVFIYTVGIANLNLQDNGLNSIGKGGLKHLKNLEELNLSGNKLEIINKEMFPSDLAKVTSLNLSNAGVKTIHSDAFDSLSALTALNLDGNSVVNFPKDLLKSLLDKGIDVDVRNNNWKCNCDMFLYRQWMVENKINTSMICAMPDTVKGRDVMEMTIKEDFGCQEPKIRDCCNQNVTLFEGEEAIFKCEIETGDPKPNITIAVINGDPLPMNHTDISTDKATIVIYDLEITNGGNFSCTANNIWGNITKTYELIVVTLPTTLEPNTTTEIYNTTTYQPTTVTGAPSTGTPIFTSIAPPSVPPTSGPSGVVIGIIVVVVLILLALLIVLIIWLIRRARNGADDRSSLVANSSPAVQA